MFSTAFGAISGNNLILIVPSVVSSATRSSFSFTSVDNCGSSREFKSTDSDVVVLSEELEVVVVSLQAVNRKRLVAAANVSIIFFI